MPDIRSQNPSPADGGSALPPLTTRITPLHTLEDIESKWQALEAAADCSFFQSWGWIGTWLAQAQRHCHLHIYQASRANEIIALAIIDIDNLKRRRIITSRTIALNESVNAEHNMFVEYNGLLTRKGDEKLAWTQFLLDLAELAEQWDEIRLTNVPAECADEAIAAQLNLRLVLDAENSPWIADLRDISDVDSIIAKLGRKRRWQLRRSIREYEKAGPLSIDAAADIEQALAYFDEMGKLHSARWQRVGRRGAYARDNWVAFHRDLIARTFDLNNIQLLRIRCGERDIGFIYNFIWRGAALVLQTGFASEQQNILRPGYVSHLLAMQFNAELGTTHYDFMIGDSEYKRTLGQAGARQLSVRLQRPRFKFAAEKLLQTIARATR